MTLADRIRALVSDDQGIRSEYRDALLAVVDKCEQMVDKCEQMRAESAQTPGGVGWAFRRHLRVRHRPRTGHPDRGDPMTRNVHLTDGTGENYWSVGDERGSVSLTAYRHTGPGYEAAVAESPSARDFLAETAGGWWVFDVLQSHRLATGDSDCSRHVACQSDAFTTRIALPLWDRVRAACVTDEAVFAELAALHANEFQVAS